MKINKDNTDSNPEVQTRLKQLKVIIDLFEETHDNYGPVSIEELSTRINKVIRDFDRELKKNLELKFKNYWTNTSSNKRVSLSSQSGMNEKIPRFLKNYKKN